MYVMEQQTPLQTNGSAKILEGQKKNTMLNYLVFTKISLSANGNHC